MRAGGTLLPAEWDRWGAFRADLGGLDAAALARTQIDLCVVSVLLDAGAGPEWRYQDADTGQVLARSEGLAVASLAAFRAGLFSAHGLPQADAAGLAGVEAAALGRAFQVSDSNALAGLEGRAALMRNLGAAVLARPDLFAEGRIGGLYDVLALAGEVRAAALLATLLDGLGPAWPSRVVLAGRPLGDVWPHPAVPGDGLVPFHKLSQWLAYSLIEVFEDAGVPVTGIADLTGLPEYRNGGLLLDLGVLRLRDPAVGGGAVAAGPSRYRGMAGADRRLAGPPGATDPGAPGPGRGRAAAVPHPGGRHLGRRPCGCCRAPSRWRPAAAGGQRRNGVLKSYPAPSPLGRGSG